MEPLGPIQACNGIALPLPLPGIFPGGKGGRCVGLTKLPSSCADCRKIWDSLNLLEPLGPIQACNGIALLLPLPGIFPGGKGGRCVGLTKLPPSCADCRKIWDSLNLLEPSGIVQACNGIAACVHSLATNVTG